MKNLWNVHLKVPVSLISPLLELIQERDGIVVKMVGPDDTKDLRGKRMHYAGGKRNKGVLGRDLILNTLVAAAGNRVRRPVLGNLFVQHGFSPNSLSPALCELKNNNRIGFDRESIWLVAAEVKAA